MSLESWRDKLKGHQGEDVSQNREAAGDYQGFELQGKEVQEVIPEGFQSLGQTVEKQLRLRYLRPDASEDC